MLLIIKECVTNINIYSADHILHHNDFFSGSKKPSEFRRLIFASAVGLLVGLSVGITATKYGLMTGASLILARDFTPSSNAKASGGSTPRGTGALPRGIIAPSTDLYLRRLWGNPEEDLPFKEKYLVTFTVGYDQKDIIKAAISKFSKNWTIVLFHYDGRTSEWEEFEWSQRAIHISARRQTKWWFAKRFLHPDVVEPFEYIFIWDEDLDVQHFNAEEYIRLVRKHGLEISQPGLEPDRGLTWQMTKRLGNSEVHKSTEEKPGWCPDPHKPPCAGFVEIMAPVFSRTAWRCVWHMIQNDLVHGWGLDFTLGKCAEPAHEKIGVVDSQYIVHKVVPSLGNQGKAATGKTAWEGVRERCHQEWKMYKARMEQAEKEMRETSG
ncbi:hypothetical protein GOP47_0029192 [Adiantum capillus-veneris]|nr:hypothetical protein GOP47_0029192 [Adiantum capillus-veneris]